MSTLVLPYLGFVGDDSREQRTPVSGYWHSPSPWACIHPGAVAFVLVEATPRGISPAQKKLDEMTGLGVNWNELGSAPPTEESRKTALLILDRSFLMDRVRPSYVTASAEGGVGIVYKSENVYAAIECLNSGEIWLLGYEPQGSPFSREIVGGEDSIEAALDQIVALHADA